MPQDGFYGHADEKTGELHGAVRDVAEGNADLAIGPIHALQEMYDQLHELPRVKEGFSRTVFVFGVEHEYVSRTPAFTEAVHFDVRKGTNLEAKEMFLIRQKCCTLINYLQSDSTDTGLAGLARMRVSSDYARDDSSWLHVS